MPSRLGDSPQRSLSEPMLSLSKMPTFKKRNPHRWSASGTQSHRLPNINDREEFKEDAFGAGIAKLTVNADIQDPVMRGLSRRITVTAAKLVLGDAEDHYEGEDASLQTN